MVNLSKVEAETVAVDVAEVDTELDAAVVVVIIIVVESLRDKTVESLVILILAVRDQVVVHRTKVRIDLVLEMIQVATNQEKTFRE